jgi:hypothetical protein
MATMNNQFEDLRQLFFTVFQTQTDQTLSPRGPDEKVFNTPFLNRASRTPLEEEKSQNKALRIIFEECGVEMCDE